MHTRIKICGITRPEDAVLVAELGADAIGLVFYDQSPRHVSISQASELLVGLPPFITVVGLFVDAQSDFIHSILNSVPLDLLQFHGNESPENCGSFNRPYIKAIRMREGTDINDYVDRYQDANGLLLDTYQQGTPGGTGEAFNWTSVPQGLKQRIILAGGLTPENVIEAINTVRPYGIDVSGGVEATKGIKDPDKMAAFIKNVRSV